MSLLTTTAPKMPDNTWFTPYKFQQSKCLSVGPSQGIVYELNEEAVIKLPFQYPVGDGSTTDEAKDHLYLSLRSLALLKRERHFYDLLAEAPHPNIVHRFPSEREDSLVLEHLNPIAEAWPFSTRGLRERWIQQLLDALVGIEKLGYLHGDITIRNIAVSHDNQLKLFDFGSIVHYTDEDFDEQVLDDHASLAACIHFLASGVDPLSKAKNVADLQKIRNDLEQGTAIIEEAAGDLEEVIRAGWMRIPRSPFSFLQLQKRIADIFGGSAANRLPSPELKYLLGMESTCPAWLYSQPDRDARWMDEVDYRAAWKEKGYEVPSYI